MIESDFERRYGRPPDVVVAAPGRVNLIGEHTDYSHLPVMPMAIDRSVEIAVARADDGRIEAASLAMPDALSARPLDDAPDGWHRYLVAALREAGAAEGLRVLVGGDLPHTGGLSSSSALTVGMLSALSRLDGRSVEPADLVRQAVRAERSLGIEGGEMDQTVIVYARRGQALRIDFAPTRLRPVPIPAGLTVVAAYSGEDAPKGGRARQAYNASVVAGRAAAALAARLHGIEIAGALVLREVVSVLDPDDLPDTVTARDAARRGGVELDRLVGLSAGRFDPDHPLPVRVVAGHVLDEARRVDAMEVALGGGDLAQAGRVLDASHASLGRFGAGTPALDRLTAAMRSAGALGARLTGAGFGGYAIAMCEPPARDDVIGAAVEATGGPAFPVAASDGVG